MWGLTTRTNLLRNITIYSAKETQFRDLISYCLFPLMQLVRLIQERYSGLQCGIHNSVKFIAAGHQPVADHILERFEIFRSMVPWFDGSINL